MDYFRLRFPSDLVSEKKEFLALINGCHECEILPTPEVDLFICLREKAESVVCSAPETEHVCQDVV